MARGIINNLFFRIKVLFSKLLTIVPTFRFIMETRVTQTPVTFKHWLKIRKNKGVYWPIHSSSIVSGPKNIFVGIDVAPGMMPGCYIQAFHGKIYLGDYTQIAANVGIISANHDLYDSRVHKDSTVFIGKYCWLGFASVILPNVILGDHTIVGANSVVTKSFTEGYCVIAGNPAKVVKRLNPDECIEFQNEYKYHGLIKDSEYNKYRLKNLNVDDWQETFDKLHKS